MTDAPERIWLLPHDGEQRCWCNHPDPSGMGHEDEADEYIRADLVAAMEAERAENLRLREAHKAAVEIAETIYYNPAGSLWNHGTAPTAKDRAEWKGARDAALEILQCLDPERARAALAEGGSDE